MLQNVGYGILGLLVIVVTLLAFAAIGLALVWSPKWLLWAIIVGVVLMVTVFWPAIECYQRREDTKRRFL